MGKNPIPQGAIYLQIIMQMIFIEQLCLEMWNFWRIENTNKKFSFIIDTWIQPVKKQAEDQIKQLCPYTLG